MAFGYARANREVYLLTRLLTAPARMQPAWHPETVVPAEPQVQLEEHRHDETCTCQLRGE